jgi:hypothetical protein
MTQNYKNKIEKEFRVINPIRGMSEDPNFYIDKNIYNIFYTTLEEKDAEIKKMSPQINEEIKVLNEIKDMVEDFQKEVDKTKIILNRKRLSYKSLDQSARRVVNRHITKEQLDGLPEDIKAIVDPSRISAYEGKGRKRKTQGKRKGNKKSQRK